MQPELAYDASEPTHDPHSPLQAAVEYEQPGAPVSHVEELKPQPRAESAGLELDAERETAVSFATAGLPADADADLLLQAVQKREGRTFAIKFATILCGFTLAAYLAGSGNAAIVQGVIHMAVGALAGAGGLLFWQRRQKAD